MTRLQRGLIVAAVHLAMVLGIGAKLLVDRWRYPREWRQAMPYDPNLPIRGRYVRIRLVGTGEPLAYFIPEHVPDPSIRQKGEELWVEVTLPAKGPPRPIRLGVKKSGVITPLALD